nr:nonstructural polyprotein [Hepelivirales sp.]
MSLITYLSALDEQAQLLANDAFNHVKHNDGFEKVDFSMTKSQLEILKNYLSERVIIHTGKNIENTHPVHAHLTRLCYRDIEAELKGVDNVIEIGTSFSRSTNVLHNCILLSDLRTFSRYTQQAVNLHRHNKPLANDLFNAVSNRTNTICHDGAEHCDYKADYAFSVHVNYDITIEKTALIMEKHDIKIMYIYMYLPVSLVDNKLTDIINGKYGFIMQSDGDNATFALGDRSFVYTHNHKTWADYLKVTKVNIKPPSYKFSARPYRTVTFEIDRSWGPLCRIKAVRTVYAPGLLLRATPVYDFVNQLVIIPDMYVYIYTGFQSLDKFIILPRELSDKCLNYISRMPDDSVKYNNFEAYFSAQCSTVSFDGTVVWHGWKAASPEELRHTTISLYAIGIANRRDRSKLISNFSKELQTPWQSHTGDGKRLRTFKKFTFGNHGSRRRYVLNKLCCGTVNYINNTPLEQGIERLQKHYLANLHPQPIQLPNQYDERVVRVNIKPYQLYEKQHAVADNKIHDDDDIVVIQNLLDEMVSNVVTNEEQHSDAYTATDTLYADDETQTPSLDDYIYDHYSQKPKKRIKPKTVDASSSTDVFQPSVDYTASTQTRIADKNAVEQNINDVYNRIENALQSHQILYTKNEVKRKCKVYYDPPRDGYCARQVISQYYHNTLPRNCDLINFISNVIQGADLYLHINVGHRQRAFFFGAINKKSEDTLICTYDYDTKHYSIPTCLCGGGISIDTTFDDNEYFVDNEYWEKIRTNYPTNKYKDRVVDKIKEVIQSSDIFEISAAPGHFAGFCINNGMRYACGVYKGPGALNMTANIPADTIQEFNSIKELKIPPCDTVFCDIGDEKALADVADDIINLIGDKKCVIKVFTNDITTCNKFARWMVNFKVHKPTASLPCNSEIYMIKNNGSGLPSSQVFEYLSNHLHPRKLDYKIIDISVKIRNIENYIKSLTKSKLHDDIKRSVKANDINIYAECYTGVAGCGKTRAIELSSKDVYVTPVSKLKTEKHHMTFEVFLHSLLSGKKYNVAYIDEAAMIPKGWYGAVMNTGNLKSMILLGDPHQIDLVDFNDIYDSDDAITLPEWSSSTTLRFGNQTAALLNRLLNGSIPKIEAQKEDRVHLAKATEHSLFDLSKQYQVIHFHQEDKKLFKNSISIHEAQGSTFPKVALYISGKEIEQQYIRNYRYTYVGMTRHQDELLIVVNDSKEANTYLYYLDSILQVNCSTGVEPIADVHIGKTNNRVIASIPDNTTDVGIDDIASVEEILLKCGFTPNDSPIITYVDANLPPMVKSNTFGDQSKAKLRVRNVDTQNTVLKGYRPSTHNFVRHYQSNNPIQTLHTIIERYTKVAQRKSYKKFTPYFNMVDQLQKGMLKFTAFKNKEDYYQWMAPTFEDLQYHCTEYLKSLQDKINPKVLNELNTLHEDVKLSIDFFMKKQPKFMAKPVDYKTKCDRSLLSQYEPEYVFGQNVNLNDRITTTQKAGQGVSAWPKRVNLIFAAYTRHLMLKLIDMPAADGSDLIIGVGRSDREIGMRISDALYHHKNIFAFKGDDTYIKWMNKQLATDFEQHDTSHSLVVKMWFCYDMINMGFPKIIVAKYWNAYVHWCQKARDDMEVTVDNVFMQHSGSPDTIHGNTKLTMGANGACYNFCTDGIIKRKKIEDVTKADCSAWLELNTDLQNAFGFRLKEDFGNPAEFICNFITDYGFFPDVVRRSARYISKVYQSVEDFQLTRDNIRDAVSTVTSDAAMQHGIYTATKYYNNHGYAITSGDVELLYRFLQNDTLKYVDDKQALYYIEALYKPS